MVRGLRLRQRVRLRSAMRVSNSEMPLRLQEKDLAFEIGVYGLLTS
jgi:hypothetical protein